MEAAVIYSVTPKADLRVERNRGGEPSGAVEQKPKARKEDAEARSTPRASAERSRIEEAATRVNEVLSLANPQLRIRVDDETERVVVKVVEQESGEVIRQIPPEELLELEKYLSSPKGLLLQEQG
ncbi:putative Flagellar protein FlaG [Candidatus Nitrospira nitrificans]|uniref:Putative Flagellar protein FlaG n=1 Tax=Candidatus Nitrospira nitrificans TaxID=1742973 RepID=A0A0S4L2U1_9BACT|nr:putative Flagellar protein FlaG [Candidatus Nitrospira nitrificans]